MPTTDTLLFCLPFLFSVSYSLSVFLTQQALTQLIVRFVPPFPSVFIIYYSLTRFSVTHRRACLCVTENGCSGAGIHAFDKALLTFGLDADLNSEISAISQ